MGDIQKKRWLNSGKFILKVIISATALYFVFRKVDFALTIEKVKSAHLEWLLAAALIFNVSKIISTWRVKAFLQALQLRITNGSNIRLYYIGAFYNLFLPGSIGGDGYKIWLLIKQFNAPIRKMTSVIFLDRLSGLVALAFLTFIMLLSSSCEPRISGWRFYTITLASLIYPMYYLAFKKLFKDFLPAFMTSNYFSILSQLLQVACAWLVLLSLNATGNTWDYLSLFMLAAVVSVIPFTIGGLGARETVSAFGAEIFHVNKETAVTFALLFFFIMAVSALAGLFFAFDNAEKS